ncbi:MAG TPA: TrbC/VirB2 family protein [Bryobacteraceae bacterium]|nr:TrbC/VirB2 family protein [Bryobacteraceae bacterium]
MNRVLKKQTTWRIREIATYLHMIARLLNPNRILLAGLAALATVPSAAFAQSPWETAVNNLQVSFTGPIAKGLSLVAIVVGGLMFAYGEGAGKKVFAGIVFGIGMALGAVNFMNWMFP